MKSHKSKDSSLNRHRLLLLLVRLVHWRSESHYCVDLLLTQVADLSRFKVALEYHTRSCRSSSGHAITMAIPSNAIIKWTMQNMGGAEAEELTV